MTTLQVLGAIAGLGLVLFGLRVFMAALDENVAARVRPLVERLTQGPGSAFFTGLAATLGLQASAITVIATMALLQRSMLGLERAMFVMLGATVGTCAKAWLFVLPYHVLGPALVGGASLLLVFARRYARRKALEVVFAAGVTFFGWHLIGDSVAPALADGSLAAWIDGLDVSTFGGLAAAIGAGALVTALVQSSSTVVFLCIGLVSAGLVPLPLAAALVLGSNVGTTVTPLLASVEYRPDVRRLAVAHTLVKALGALVPALFFHAFLSFVGLVTDPLPGADDAVRLAAVHTVFNVGNALLWAPLVPLLARLLRNPEPLGAGRASFLSAPVRRILANVPGEAIGEVRTARDRVLQELKVAADDLLEALRADEEIRGSLDQRHDLRTEVLAAQELLATVLARGREWTAELQRLMHELNAMEDVLVERAELLRRLEVESSLFRRLRRERVAPALERLHRATDGLWGAILAGPDVEDLPTPDAGAFDAFEADAHRLLREGGRVQEQDVIALGKQVLHLQRIWSRLEELGRSLAAERREAAEAAAAATAAAEAAAAEAEAEAAEAEAAEAEAAEAEAAEAEVAAELVSSVEPTPAADPPTALTDGGGAPASPADAPQAPPPGERVERSEDDQAQGDEASYSSLRDAADPR